MTNSRFHTLSVQQKIQETPDTVSIRFGIPDDLKEVFRYQAGQYLTLKFNIDGTEARRAYSMSSSPLEADITVSVKRVAGGLVSNYIHDQLNLGDSIEVMPPEGRFVANMKEENRKTYYLFGAGSGITPLMSLLKTLLEKEPESTIYLYYGSRDKESIIFQTELSRLENRYKGQLMVTHILSQPSKIKASGIAGIFGKKKSLWAGETGRIDRRNAARFLDRYPPHYPHTEYFICGPGNMIDTVQDVLKARGVKSNQVHFEHFNAETPRDGSKTPTNANATGSSKVTVQLDGEVIEVEVKKGKTILDALLYIKKEPPYSCTTGSCSTCMAKVSKGKIKMDVCYALDDDEIAEGYILTCQAKPLTPEVEVNYDV